MRRNQALGNAIARTDNTASNAIRKSSKRLMARGEPIIPIPLWSALVSVDGGRGGLCAVAEWIDAVRRSVGLAGELLRRAPEDEAAGDSPNGDRNTELCGHTENAVFHRGETCAVRERHAGGGVAQCLDFFLEGV